MAHIHRYIEEGRRPLTIVRIELFLKFTLDINGLKILSTCSSIRWIRTKHKTKWRKTRIQTENEKKNVFEFFTQIKFVVTSITHISTHYFRLFCFSRMEFNLAKWKKNRSLLPLLLTVGWILCCCFFCIFIIVEFEIQFLFNGGNIDILFKTLKKMVLTFF